jgi:hypothetical protein
MRESIRSRITIRALPFPFISANQRIMWLKILEGAILEALRRSIYEVHHGNSI